LAAGDRRCNGSGHGGSGGGINDGGGTRDTPPPTIDGARRTWVARVRTQVVARQTAAKWAIGTVVTVTTKRVAGWHWLIVRCRQ
jgi:hypothetical protein